MSRKVTTLLTVVMAFVFLVASTDTKIVYRDSIVNGMLAELTGTNDPGIQYVVVNKSDTIYGASAGSADIDQASPLSMSHTMAAFSMTKVLTAIAVLQLIERTKIDLDDEVSDHIKHPYSSKITIRHLLSHTSGIPNPIPLKWAHLAEKHDQFDEKLALIDVLNEHSNSGRQPGAKYEYSNIGYWLLGELIEKVSGTTYSDYVNNNIFKVLDLPSRKISFVIENKGAHAKGYIQKWSIMNLFSRFLVDRNVLGEYEGSWLNIKTVYLNGPSFGGAIGTARAFSRVLQDLLSEESKLISVKTKELLFAQQKLNSGKKLGMTLGWHIGTLNGSTYYYKEGGGAGFHSEMRIYPDSGIASVLMTNRTSFDSRGILSKLDENFAID